MSLKPKKLEPLSPLGKSILKKIPATLSPIKKSISKDLLKNNCVKSDFSKNDEKVLIKSENEDLEKQIIYNEIEVRKRPNSSDIRNRRNIGPMEFMHLSKQEIITSNTIEKLNFLTENKKLMESKGYVESPNSEVKGSDFGVATKDEGYGTEFSVSSLGERDGGGKRELTLAGGGMVFLKSNKMKSSPSSDMVTSSFSKEELSEELLSPDVRKPTHDTNSHIKSILRDQSNQNNIEKKLNLGGMSSI